MFDGGVVVNPTTWGRERLWVGERVRGHVDDSHDQRVLDRGEGLGAKAPGHGTERGCIDGRLLIALFAGESHAIDDTESGFCFGRASYSGGLEAP